MKPGERRDYLESEGRQTMTAAPQFSDVVIGMSIGTLTKPEITRFDLVRYAVASGDFNPSHVDEVRAQAEGMGGVFAHGMIGTGYMGQLVTDWLQAGRLLSLTVRSTVLVRPGDILTVEGTVEHKRVEEGVCVAQIALTCRNQRGQQTHEGTAEVELPGTTIVEPGTERDPRVAWRVIG